MFTLSYVETWQKQSNFDYNFTPVFTAGLTEVGKSTTLNMRHKFLELNRRDDDNLEL